MEFVAEAGYTNSKTTVVKFRKGLDLQIQNTIATMAYGHPSNASLEAWYEAMKNVDQNCVANKAFKLAYQTPGPVPVCPTFLYWRMRLMASVMEPASLGVPSIL